MAIETQRTITERNVEIVTVMRPLGIVVLIGAKVLTGHTHPCDRNLTLFLETTNHFDKGPEESDLLRSRECLGCGRLADRAYGKKAHRTDSLRRQLRHHNPPVAHVAAPSIHVFRSSVAIHSDAVGSLTAG